MPIGQKVHPTEVESVLLEMPEVLDCMVYGESNAITGSVVVAEVCLAKPIATPEFRKMLRTFCRSRLAQYKVPARIRVVEKTSYGKRFKKMRIRASSIS